MGRGQGLEPARRGMKDGVLQVTIIQIIEGL